LSLRKLNGANPGRFDRQWNQRMQLGVRHRPKADIQTIEFESLMRSFIVAYLPAQLAPDHRSKKVAKLAGYENRSLCVCDMSGDTKLDLRTSISLTPNMQVTPKLSPRSRIPGSPQRPGR
jgi:hypothetical protein